MVKKKTPPTTLVSFKLSNETYKLLDEFYTEWKRTLPAVTETGARVEAGSPSIAARMLMMEALERWRKKRM